MKLSDRGLGTQLLISSPVLNIHKTRLNDPHLSMMGTNDHPGDYRSDLADRSLYGDLRAGPVYQHAHLAGAGHGHWPRGRRRHRGA